MCGDIKDAEAMASLSIGKGNPERRQFVRLVG